MRTQRRTHIALTVVLAALALSAPGALAAGPTFSDVPADHPFFTEIEWMASEGIAGGYPDGTFQPAASVSRQSMASFLYQYEGSPEVILGTPFFADVGVGHPFYAPIQWMGTTGLSVGSPNPQGGKPLFKPGGRMSRQAMAAFLWRYAHEPVVTLTEPAFADVDESHPFFEPIQWMSESGLSTGTPAPPGTPRYQPGALVSRQAMAAFLYRFANP